MAGKRYLVPIVLLLVALFVGLLQHQQTARADEFQPFSTAALESSAADASVETWLSYSLAATDIQYNLVFPSFLSPDFTIEPGRSMPVGAHIGALTSTATIAFAGAPCNTVLPVSIYLFNAETNIWDTFDLNEDRSNGILDDKCETNNGIPNHVDCYPSYLNKMFDPDDTFYTTGDVFDGIPPLVPRARYSGMTNVVGTDVILVFMQFDPGQLLQMGDPSAWDNPLSQYGPEWGYPSEIILEDPTIAESPQTITDFCAPLGSTTHQLPVSEDNPCTTGSDDRPIPCPANPPVPFGSEVGIYDGCAESIDSDYDGAVNDGCPQVGDEDEYTLNVATYCPGDGNCCDNDTDDDTDDAAEDVAGRKVNDGCPIVETTPNEGGYDRFSNPGGPPAGLMGSGTQFYATNSASYRDLDGDNIETQFDSCPLVPNVDGNPRVTAGPDLDMIDSACDPSAYADIDCPNVAAGNHDDDEDNDGVPDVGPDPDHPMVGGDNCTCVANGPLLGPNDQLDTDGDGTGDVCDPDPNAGSSSDVELDGYKNSQDNCPLVKWDSIDEIERYLPFPSDGGPRTDSVGAACDPNWDNDDELNYYECTPAWAREGAAGASTWGTACGTCVVAAYPSFPESLANGFKQDCSVALVGAYDDCDANCNGDCLDPGEDLLCANTADDDACDTAEDGTRTANDGCADSGYWMLHADVPDGSYWAGSTLNALCVDGVDVDGDGLCAGIDPDDTWKRDNCPQVANGPGDANNQTDGDSDGLGLGCDPNDAALNYDEDGDTVPNRYQKDNCPLVANANQADSDHDGIGDACDPSIYPTDASAFTLDGDSDGVMDLLDNCTNVANGPLLGPNDQDDDDGDNTGKECDPDDTGTSNVYDMDNDTIQNSDPPSIEVYWLHLTADLYETEAAGGIYSVCDDGVDNDMDGAVDGADPGCTCDTGIDPDCDGVCTGAQSGQCGLGSDNCPAIANQTQVDRDGDGQGDACDTDDDGDTISDLYEMDNPVGTYDTDWCDTMDSGRPTRPETGAECDNASDDDGDTVVNDGCPQVGDESEYDLVPATYCPGDANCCDNATDDDTDDAGEDAAGRKVNDGCPANVAATYPDPDGDGVDTATELANGTNPCNPDTDGDAKGLRPSFPWFFSDKQEGVIGTDPSDACADTATPMDERGPGEGEPVSPWPPDFNDNGFTDIGDLVGLKNHWVPIGNPYDVRYDLNANTICDIGDLVMLKTYWIGTGKDKCIVG